MSVTFESSVTTPLSGTLFTSLVVTTEVVLKFQDCKVGEYNLNGICTTCENGTYSLQTLPDNAQVCNDCTQTEGVESCYGNNIKVASNYWRRHPTNAAVIECLENSGCKGGYATGDDSCDGSFIGSLCSVCQEGTYNSGGVCESCKGGSRLSVQMIIFIVIGALVMCSAIHFLYQRYRRRWAVFKFVGNTHEHFICLTISPHIT